MHDTVLYSPLLMAHPFEKFFNDALGESTELDNLVLEKANDLLEKGYSGREIAHVLRQLAKGLIDPKEAAIVREAADEFAEFLED